jgi:sugar phosphate isomerase/epimerase
MARKAGMSGGPRDRIGVITALRPGQRSLAAVEQFGLKTCQVHTSQEDYLTEENADRLRDESQSTGVRITALSAGWSAGPSLWNLVEGPVTLGIVPSAWRAARVTQLMKAANFAARAKLPAVITHLGFVPEEPLNPLFQEVVVTVRDLASHMQRLGLDFWFETGQETPVTLLRLIQAVGVKNLGINLDPANLILYGKGNPIDALDVFGRYVKNVHAKDALYPTDPMKLGAEVKVGTGKVRFPEFVRRLDEIGFAGEFIIEREITGEQQVKDIRETVSYLETLLAKE